jgi:hypothetical protein
MHLPDGPPLDLSTQVAKVKAKTRPWKAIIALILAICAAAASGWAHKHVLLGFLSTKDIPYQILAIGLAVAFCALASVATLDLASKARTVLEPSAGPSHAAIVRYALLLIGAVTTLIITLGLLGIPIEQLVLGGALTSVFVGIAAQQSLSNVFAGIVLMLAHPFRIGDSIRMQAGALGGQVSGVIVEVGITYVRLATATGEISIPNSQVLNAVVGPLPDPSTYSAAQPSPPLIAQPSGQPSPAPSQMAHRAVLRTPRASERDPQDADPGGNQGADQGGNQPEVPPGTPEPRPSGTPT